MATTHKSIRRKLNRIIEIKKHIMPRLAEELVALASKLPFDQGKTFRSKDFPGLKVIISEPGPSGVRVDWQSVAHQLAREYRVRHHVFTRIVLENTQRVSEGQEISIRVQKDKLVDLGKVKGYLV
jgi:hypothetical protein